MEQQTNISPAEPAKKDLSAGAKIAIVAAIVFLVLVIAGGALWWLKFRKKTAEQGQPATAENTSSNTAVTSAKNNQDGLVKWYASPKEIPAPKIYKEAEDQTYKAWETGEFITGEHQGKKIILVMGESMDPGGPNIWRFVQTDKNNPDKLLLLNRYSNNLPPYVLNPEDITPDIDTNLYAGSVRINSLEYPDFLYTQRNEKMTKGNNEFPYESIWHEDTSTSEENIFFKTDLLKKAFSVPEYGDFYTTDRTKINEQNLNSIYAKNGFYVKAPDGTFRIYALAPDFVDEVDEEDTPNISWNDGGENTLNYTYQGEKGCGVGMFALVVDEKYQLADLYETGKTATGSPVYELKDKNSKFLKDYYDALKNIDESFFEGKNFTEDLSYEQFLSAHPVFFWRDTFGRLILFLSTDYINTESDGCGKPVIYLYPEKEEQISVKVAPTGGMTKSEPDYSSGWNVMADPMSRIKNLADGKTYPYLFWEGNSKEIYQMSKYGFVASCSDLEGLLNDKLAKLGLIPKEISDFKEFWLPKMLAEEKPYYFITFVPQTKIDRLAPLEISPQPDTIIRVLMDWKGLDEKIAAPGYEIKTPERKGFTAVEWGGMLK